MEFKLKKGRRLKTEERKKSYIKKILIFVIFVLILVGIITINSKMTREEQKQKDDKDLVNESTNISIDLSEKIVDEKQYKDTKIVGIQICLDKQGVSYFKCKIKNETNQTFAKEDVYFVFLDENSSELSRFRYRLPELQSGEEKYITIVTTTDITYSNDFYIEEYK